ncbi:Cupredoxin [Mariannaea sp. PMI_226]|nr:Cupredoxin [Mariannaea sp. PMI_226]
MHFNAAILAVLGLAAGASAETIKVEVGKGGLQFSPNSIKAAKGDTVEFHFDGAHSVVSGPFASPCTPASSGGFFSGPLPKGDNNVFSVDINSTDPIWFYCGVPGHCQAGMVGVINQGSDKTLSQYKSAAAKTDSTKTPGSVTGGTVGDGSSSSKPSASGTGTSSASKTSSTAAATSSNAAGGLSPMVGVSGLAAMIGGLLAL